MIIRKKASKSQWEKDVKYSTASHMVLGFRTEAVTQGPAHKDLHLQKDTDLWMKTLQSKDENHENTGRGLGGLAGEGSQLGWTESKQQTCTGQSGAEEGF